EAKARYLQKKARRKRKLDSAKKAAAPKHKEWNPTRGGNHVPMRLRVGGAREAYCHEQADNTLNQRWTGAGTSTKPSIPESSQGQEEKSTSGEGGPATEEMERARRKAEKRAKREARNLQKAAKSSAPEPETTVASDNHITGDAKESEPPQKMDVRLDEDEPQPLQAFPLPRAVPAPSTDLLLRQGLPTGLEEATFIEENLRIPLSELKMQQRGREVSAISEHMSARLSELGVIDFFAVQAALLPKLLPLSLTPLKYANLHDYLISAPTGSGKTLAYAIPIIEILSARTITRLRALIVLPTKDLVVQVRETLELLAKGTDLKIGTIGGQHSFAHEQKVLVEDLEIKELGGSSKVDILIATPGRLIDHLSQTPNFTLQHLRFLVIDEADRLLNQSYQDWLMMVLRHTRPTDDNMALEREIMPDDHVAPLWMSACGLGDKSHSLLDPPEQQCQKLLFSATLTRDPAKVASLSLNSPRYYIIQSSLAQPSAHSIGEQFAIPASLTEFMLILPPQLKPLNLIHLIHSPEYAVSSALIFTKSVESCVRLVKLLEYFEVAFGGGKVVQGYTSDMRPAERKKLLAAFGQGDVQLLVCSDLIARGMDLPTVSHVISYDIPLDMRKYVHRVGRTARAGRSGTAWTLVEKQEALHFKSILKSAGHTKQVKKVKVKEESLGPYKDSYEVVMKRLKEEFSHGRESTE
ncbi:hypothetical protein TREMEDRAFT_35235, partial [Tremella mesenterica DSM 1558]|uniref:uncharacterized protein n=1 Tax=Tremella mesenterica (strain ATCC 24925 / CBS 8224 / DSM 1558 / NBRC 9311 / NRRL Y-6157 / RJB 2259-6 / UBC 559-6) TaxID=578456 RepID=UPI00032CB2D3